MKLLYSNTAKAFKFSSQKHHELLHRLDPAHVKTKLPAMNYYESRRDEPHPGLGWGDPAQTGERSWEMEGLGSEFMPMMMTSGMKP
ncbi:unnamed protein product [Urochloa humidicola]